MGRLHRAEAPATRLDLSGLVRAYRQELQQAGTPEPAQYREVLEGLAAIERVLLATATPAVAAHGDAVVDNFVDDGSCVHVIDLEYAVRAEPWFDLATLLDSAADTDAGDEPAVDLAAALVTDYIAAVPSPYSVDLLAARVRAWRLLARAAWWPWAMLPAQRANPRAERWRDLHALSAMVAAEAKVLPEALVP